MITLNFEDPGNTFSDENSNEYTKLTGLMKPKFHCYNDVEEQAVRIHRMRMTPEETKRMILMLTRVEGKHGYPFFQVRIPLHHVRVVPQYNISHYIRCSW